MSLSSNTHGIARIVKPAPDGTSEKHVGMACIVDVRHVITCCHVVNDALGRRNRLDPEKPSAETSFSIRFPYADHAAGSGVVVQWGFALPAAKDVAVLELTEDAPAEAGVVVFSEIEVQRETWFCIGYDAEGAGRETQGICGPILPNGERQLNGPDGVAVARIVGGYSGGAVWSDKHNAIVGMVVTKDRDQTENGLAYAVPTGVLLQIWPKLLQMRNGRLFDPNLAEAQVHRKAHIVDDDLVVLDRTLLSQHLGRLRAKGAQKRVILVRGDPDSGKTHCRHLFELVAREVEERPSVYLDRDLMPTVDDTVGWLFSALNASDRVPPRDSTPEAWYATVLRQLRETAVKEKATLWVAIDDLGFDRDGVPLIDPEVRNFFEQFVLQMKNPAFADSFRLMLIHYPAGNLPTKWDRNVVLQEITKESDVQQEHVVELLKLWLKKQQLYLPDAAIEKRAAELIARAESPTPPGQEPAPRLERIHNEVIKELPSLRRPLT